MLKSTKNYDYFFKCVSPGLQDDFSPPQAGGYHTIKINYFMM